MIGELLARRVAVRLFMSGPPGVIRCPRCGLPALDRAGRPRPAPTVTYARGSDGSSTGLALLCSWCWPRTTVEQRIGYARALVMFGPWRVAMTVDECEAVMSAIEQAIRAGR